MAATLSVTELAIAENALGQSNSSIAILTSLPPLLGEEADVVGKVNRQTAIEAVAARRERRRSINLSTPIVTALSPASSHNNQVGGVSFTPTDKNRVTMAHFLRDTGIGQPMKQPAAAPAKKSSPRRILTRSATGSSPQKKLTPSSSVAVAVAPRVRVVNGEIVVDEEATSLASTTSAQSDIPMDIVNETGRHLTSHAFVKTIGNNRWSRDDTELFYDALSMCGTDFSLISILFPRRSREQVKGKYKVEERANPSRIAMALKNRKALDAAWFDRAKKEREELEGGGKEK